MMAVVLLLAAVVVYVTALAFAYGLCSAARRGDTQGQLDERSLACLSMRAADAAERYAPAPRSRVSSTQLSAGARQSEAS
jgi:hypothetical protein